jgi:hypothetical protein
MLHDVLKQICESYKKLHQTHLQNKPMARSRRSSAVPHQTLRLLQLSNFHSRAECKKNPSKLEQNFLRLIFSLRIIWLSCISFHHGKPALTHWSASYSIYIFLFTYKHAHNSEIVRYKKKMCTQIKKRGEYQVQKQISCLKNRHKQNHWSK